jgi:hypothetical protein
MEVIPKPVTSVGPPLINGSYHRNLCQPTIADESYYANFRQLLSADESYWAITSVGYGWPTEVTQFFLKKPEIDTASCTYFYRIRRTIVIS